MLGNSAREILLGFLPSDMSKISSPCPAPCLNSGGPLFLCCPVEAYKKFPSTSTPSPYPSRRVFEMIFGFAGSEKSIAVISPAPQSPLYTMPSL